MHKCFSFFLKQKDIFMSRAALVILKPMLCSFAFKKYRCGKWSTTKLLDCLIVVRLIGYGLARKDSRI